MRAAPLVASASKKAADEGRARGRLEARAALERVFFAKDGPEATYINEPKERVIVIPYPPPRRMGFATSHPMNGRLMTETFRWAPWSVRINESEIRWFNLEPDSEDGRKRARRDVTAVCGQCQGHIARWLGDTRMAEEVGSWVTP